ncbi:MAG: methyltransferase domain-containing protein [Deltaproteobacteria bacterium]|jgi:SAM-dependent methyltransferase
MSTGQANNVHAIRNPPTPRQLNLGCGRFPKEGFVNVDWAAAPGVDVIHDLTALPYPFEDSTFERIEADHVLEHLPQVFEVMAEIHRLLAPGGTLVLRVPHFSRGFSHPEHKRGFDATFPYYFDPAFPGGFTGTHFICESVRLRWFAQPYLKKTVLPRPLYDVGRFAGAVIDRAANLSPLVCSRLWCYYVGGFEEIEFVMRRP